MAELFPSRVILNFPPKMYLLRGVGQLCPLLVHAWHVKKISAAQFLHRGCVRVTVHEPAFREELQSTDVTIEGRKIPVTPAGVRSNTVFACDLPLELSDESTKSAFSTYEDVYSVRGAFFKDFPDLRNGIYVFCWCLFVIPTVILELPWLSGQPVKRSICNESGHSPRAYGSPVSSLATQLVSAWGQPYPTVPVSALPDAVIRVVSSEEDEDFSFVTSKGSNPVPISVPSPSPSPASTVSNIPDDAVLWLCSWICST